MSSTIFMSLLVLSNLACTPAPQPDKTTDGINIEDTAVAKNTSIIAPVTTKEIKQVTLENTSPTSKQTSQPKIIAPTVTVEATKTPMDTPVSNTSPPAPKLEGTIPSKQTEEKETVSEEPKLTEVPIEAIEEDLPPDHSSWTSLLQKYVNSKGDVNYAGFKRDQSLLEDYLNQLAQNPVTSGWSRNEQLAYWINAYNAFTVKLIVDNYPVKSITNLKGGKPWDVKWIQLGGKTYSLNQIENEIIRPQFKEPRIHFAVNCAAESCPPILNKAWTAAQLNTYFEQQTKAFINNSAYNQITPNRVQVSKIFDWYGEDFGNLIDFLNQYSNTKIKANAKVSFLEYDWSLNKQ